MTKTDLADLLSRAAAFIEDNHSLDQDEHSHLIEDLLTAEKEFRPDTGERVNPLAD